MSDATYTRPDKDHTVASANQQLRQRAADKCKTVPSQKGCVSMCSEAKAPELHPCFEIRWGDSVNDQIETDDLEVFCLVVSNPYNNVTLKDVTVIHIEMTIEGQPAPSLPDGQRSVMITPSAMIAFGDLGPSATDAPTKAVREVVLVSKGARRGEYKLRIDYGYTVEFALSNTDSFPLNLERS